MFINEANQELVTQDALELLTLLLEFDPYRRILPRDALQHPFFMRD